MKNIKIGYMPLIAAPIYSLNPTTKLVKLEELENNNISITSDRVQNAIYKPLNAFVASFLLYIAPFVAIYYLLPTWDAIPVTLGALISVPAVVFAFIPKKMENLPFLLFAGILALFAILFILNYNSIIVFFAIRFMFVFWILNIVIDMLVNQVHYNTFVKEDTLIFTLEGSTSIVTRAVLNLILIFGLFAIQKFL